MYWISLREAEYNVLQLVTGTGNGIAFIAKRRLRIYVIQDRGQNIPQILISLASDLIYAINFIDDI